LATDRGHPREEAAQRSPQAGPQAEDQLENLLRGRQEKLRRRQARRRRQRRRRKRSKTAGVDVIKLFFASSQNDCDDVLVSGLPGLIAMGKARSLT
jgi:hypothetical protein